MSSVPPLPAPGPTITPRQRDHQFFSLMATIAVIAVLLGFARTYYFRPIFDLPPLSRLLHLHGATATAWLVLLLVQVRLVAVHRVQLHRQLGILGVFLTLAFLGIGYHNAVTSARLGILPPNAPPARVFLAVSIVTLLLFAVLVAGALLYRRRPAIHKRLMLLAAITMLGPAFARMRFLGPGGPYFAIGGTAVLYLACMAYDRWAHGRVHPVYLWGGLALIVSLPFRFFVIGHTTAWQAIADWLMS